MKLKFKEQQYQIDAVYNIVRVFSGQEKGYRKETVGRAGMFADEIFSNKKIEISNSDILKNVQELQREQGLHPVASLQGGLNFTVEMETGTGKTYVYTRAMLELHKQYGWNKFIIMVPSVAIREGVYKSLDITEDHFQELYGKKIRFFIYDTKNKTNITNIQKFGNSADIEVIVMNYQAFGRRGQDALKMFQKLDVIQSQKPIDVIKRVRPILIIDEPQRFGPTAEGMLGEFNPLFILRFSATHKKDFNKIYRLDAIDAYNQKLVKKIKVKGIEVTTTLGTSGYLYLEKINVFKDRNPTASIEMEVNQANSLSKKIKNIKEGDNLFEISGYLQQYDGYIVREINAKNNTVSFINGNVLTVGQVVNDPYEIHSRRIQIRETIKSHIEKERELFKKGIKVLSLFFIDEVAKYRAYDTNGNQIESEYEKIFEEEYKNIISKKTLFDEDYYKYISSHPIKRIHKGYFSIDRRGQAINSRMAGGGELGSDDVNAYDLIMKDKERLLSFNEPTRFIFSHSALREGWDNPNIFQICTLRHVEAEGRKRQEIGRGLRIAVDQKGERMDYDILGSEFFDINTLTIIANESYDHFAKQLQEEILESIKSRPTKLEVSVLKGRLLVNNNEERIILDETTSMKIIMSFTQKGYIDNDFKVQESLIEAIENKTFEIPEALSNFKDQIAEIMLDIYTTNTYKPTENELDNQVPSVLKPNENFAKKEFQELWKKLKIKTIYTVDFDTKELIKKSINAINKELNVKKVITRITGGEQVDEITENTLRNQSTLLRTINQLEHTVSILSSIKYDVVGEISRNARITRKTSGLILSGINIDKFAQFKVNPEDFIKQVSRIINEQKATTLINKIQYDKTKDTYEDDIFTINNFSGSLKKDIIKVKNHIYDYVKTDSNIEKKFAEDLDIEENKICVYAKLPLGFKIPTPVGNYNPDWAIVFNSDNVKHVYFIAETKGSMSTMQLKKLEELKIGYARKHFALLKDEDVEYDVVSTYDDLLNNITI